MRFLGYTLGDESVPAPPPTPEPHGGDEARLEEATKSGVLVATGGLAPTAMGAKITLKDGKFTVIDGPFTEAKELIGGWALMECRDLEEAVEWAKRFVSVVGEGEVRVRRRSRCGSTGSTAPSDLFARDRARSGGGRIGAVPVAGSTAATEAAFRIEFARLVAGLTRFARRSTASTGIAGSTTARGWC